MWFWLMGTPFVDESHEFFRWIDRRTNACSSRTLVTALSPSPLGAKVDRPPFMHAMIITNVSKSRVCTMRGSEWVR
jgi:hypothetical protein